MKYRIKLNRAISEGLPGEIADALLEAVYNDDDPAWLQEMCELLLEYPNEDVRGLAATCLGHIARLHRTIDVPRAKFKLDEFRAANPNLAGRADDAWGDIVSFMYPHDASEDDLETISAAWVETLVFKEFERAGFSSRDEGTNWPVRRTCQQVEWLVNIAASRPDDLNIMVSAALVDGPSQLRARPRGGPKTGISESYISWTCAEFSPGVDIGVPPETSFGQCGYDEHMSRVLDLTSDLSISERAREIRDIAERVSGVSSRVRTLNDLREFIAEFTVMSPVSKVADPWLRRGGTHYELTYDDIVSSKEVD